MKYFRIIFPIIALLTLIAFTSINQNFQYTILLHKSFKNYPLNPFPCKIKYYILYRNLEDILSQENSVFLVKGIQYPYRLSKLFQSFLPENYYLFINKNKIRLKFKRKFNFKETEKFIIYELPLPFSIIKKLNVKIEYKDKDIIPVFIKDVNTLKRNIDFYICKSSNYYIISDKPFRIFYKSHLLPEINDKNFHYIIWRSFRAIVERNVKIILVPYSTDYALIINLFNKIKQKVHVFGFKFQNNLQKIKYTYNFKVNLFFRFVWIFFIVAFLRKKIKSFYILIISLIILFIPSIGYLIIVYFASLYIIRNYERSIKGYINMFLITVSCGILLYGYLFSYTTFYLAVPFVKIAFIIPFAVYLIHNTDVNYDYLKKTIIYKNLFFILISIILIIFSLIKFSPFIEVWQFEEKFREIMYTVFLIRPRFKEILIGYPALILFSFLKGLQREKRFFIGFLSNFVIASIFNSFFHIHTPIFISFLRSLTGIITGTIIGLIFLGSYYILKHLTIRPEE